MPNTKRDKYDEAARHICAEAGLAAVYHLRPMAAYLRSAFPPPAEDARKLAEHFGCLHIDEASSKIESFAESRVEPWREAIKKIAYDEVSPLGDVCPEDYDRLRNIARALLFDSPAPKTFDEAIAQAGGTGIAEFERKAPAPGALKHIVAVNKMVPLLCRVRNALAGQGHRPFGDQGHELNCPLCSAAEMVEQVIYYATERSATT